MENSQDPNNQRKITDDIKREVTRRAKQSAMKAASKAARAVAKAIAKAIATAVKWFITVLGPWGIAILMIIIFIIALTMNVFDKISSFIESMQTKTYARVQTADDEVKAMVSLTEDLSGFTLNGEYSKELIKELDNVQVDTDHYGFTTDDYSEDDDVIYTNDDELNNIIDKYVRAEITTMFPKIESSTGIDGCIEVRRKGYRTDAHSDGVWIDEKLTYVPYTQLETEEKIIATNDTQAAEYLSHFSINPDNFKLCLLIESRTYIWIDDETHTSDPDMTAITFEMEEIEYQSTIQQYATPINYLIAVHLIGENVDYMEELVEKIKDSTIVLTYVETPLTTDIQYIYRGMAYTEEKYEGYYITRQYEYEYDEDGKVIGKTLVSTGGGGIYEDLGVVATKELDTREKCKEYISDMKNAFERYVENTGELVIEKVKTWIFESNKEILAGERQYLEFSVPSDDREGYNPDWHVVGHVDGGGDEYEFHYDILDRDHYIITGTPYAYKYRDITNIVDKGAGILSDDYIAFLDEYPDVKNKITSSPSLLYYMLEQNENTQQLENAMKYTIPQVTGVPVQTSVFNLLNEETGATGLDMAEYIDTDEWEDANDIQKKIVEIVVGNKIAGQKGYCLKWTRLVGEAAGAVTTGGMGYARNAGSQFGVSTDFTYIPIGAVLYGLGSTNSVYGHCGIYIGNNKVASCLGPGYANTINGIKFDDLSYFKERYRVVCWGWYSTTAVNDQYPVSSVALMTNKKGVI